jgi:hypothetical protein
LGSNTPTGSAVRISVGTVCSTLPVSERDDPEPTVGYFALP